MSAYNFCMLSQNKTQKGITLQRLTEVKVNIKMCAEVIQCRFSSVINITAGGDTHTFHIFSISFVWNLKWRQQEETLFMFVYSWCEASVCSHVPSVKTVPDGNLGIKNIFMVRHNYERKSRKYDIKNDNDQLLLEIKVNLSSHNCVFISILSFHISVSVLLAEMSFHRTNISNKWRCAAFSLKTHAVEENNSIRKHQ